jgi:hypothetical protein
MILGVSDAPLKKTSHFIPAQRSIREHSKPCCGKNIESRYRFGILFVRAVNGAWLQVFSRPPIFTFRGDVMR